MNMKQKELKKLVCNSFMAFSKISSQTFWTHILILESGYLRDTRETGLQQKLWFIINDAKHTFQLKWPC